ncbi:MAG TPA: hypothetical protein VGK64_23135 [Bryobacteraceae bacterium]
MSLLSLAAWLVLAACSNNMKSRDKVQQAILSRLQEHSGLDLKNLDVNTTAVTFDKNMAYATVFFHPKGDPKLDGGMTMKYTLTNKDGKWVVVNVADSQGHGINGRPRGGGTDLPPGHPPLDSGNPSSSPAPAR